MTPDVTKVVATADFLIEVEFSNHEVRQFDMRPYLQYPAFATLKQPGKFLRARVEHGTVVWSDDIDLSPDTLYLRSKPISSADQS
ncbi:DUF2442 domain-containing protein [Rhodoferax sp.]|uniref:DUF2442 domain-containing protein n=1 Tax=Rhodoferax sp. TaxID=50421 RepID=UPI00262E99ED|nr:DUF2442 domain-containing protein [Rhodoferax sp.]MDD2809723.1 DUF2442 domain-containing protein [Rhodoferax sp.]MDD4944479.1 DUF2442 domain-containing protein [Rhodoferax sp.]